MSYDNPDYGYKSASLGRHHDILLPVVDMIVNQIKPVRIFDLGCGNGSVAAHLSDRAEVVGIDPSPSAVEHANQAYPKLNIEIGSAYDDLAAKYGSFQAVVSLEVVEHLYDPRRYANTIFDLLEPGGVAIISTPYHGYWKNLAVAVAGGFDTHFTALWDGGHIKFWSIKTLSELMNEAGFEVEAVHRVGRIPHLAKSMVLRARKPA